MNIKSTPVKATTRKLKAHWSIQAAEDLKKYHGAGEEMAREQRTDCCYHCGKPFEDEISDWVKINRRNGLSFFFHLECFTDMAGADYIPTTHKEAQDASIKENSLTNDWNKLAGLAGLDGLIIKSAAMGRK